MKRHVSRGVVLALGREPDEPRHRDRDPVLLQVVEHDLDLVELVALLHLVEHALDARLEPELEELAAALGERLHVLLARVDLLELDLGVVVERQLLASDLARNVGERARRRERIEEMDVPHALVEDDLTHVRVDVLGRPHAESDAEALGTERALAVVAAARRRVERRRLGQAVVREVDAAVVGRRAQVHVDVVEARGLRRPRVPRGARARRPRRSSSCPRSPRRGPEAPPRRRRRSRSRCSRRSAGPSRITCCASATPVPPIRNLTSGILPS